MVGLEINDNKTKYLNNAPANISNGIELNGARYEQVQNFKYLGSTVLLLLFPSSTVQNEPWLLSQQSSIALCH